MRRLTAAWNRRPSVVGFKSSDLVSERPARAVRQGNSLPAVSSRRVSLGRGPVSALRLRRPKRRSSGLKRNAPISERFTFRASLGPATASAPNLHGPKRQPGGVERNALPGLSNRLRSPGPVSAPRLHRPKPKPSGLASNALVTERCTASNPCANLGPGPVSAPRLHQPKPKPSGFASNALVSGRLTAPNRRAGVGEPSTHPLITPRLTHGNSSATFNTCPVPVKTCGD
jgi:hypothetical protein